MTGAEHAGGKILAETRGNIGVLTFNHPERRNAMTLEMWDGLSAALSAFRADPAVHVVVLRGAGGKAFVSGGDISQYAEHRTDAAATRAYTERTAKGREALARFPKPTIACIQGYCLGGGLAIAMMADLRLASPDSRFGIPAARLGIAYGMTGLQTLVSLVGPAHARMLMYTGKQIGAQEAERLGLINQVVPAEELEATVFALAEQIGGNAPLAVAAAKMGISEGLKDPAERNTEALERMTDTCFNSDDYREGRTAFMEKRKPEFTGR
jgi:enoyl-CoA hydratase